MSAAPKYSSPSEMAEASLIAWRREWRSTCLCPLSLREFRGQLVCANCDAAVVRRVPTYVRTPWQ